MSIFAGEDHSQPLARLGARLTLTLYIKMKNILPIVNVILICMFGVNFSAQANECVALEEQSCLESKKCILKQKTNKEYYCSEAKIKCEVGFVQWGKSSESSCTTNKECRYIPANCYCAPKVTCRCGGSAPAICASDE